MSALNLKFDVEKLKLASQQTKEMRENIKAVKGEDYERHLSFFISLAAIGDLIHPDCIGMASIVMRNLGMAYIITAKINDDDQKEMATTIKRLEEMVGAAEVK